MRVLLLGLGYWGRNYDRDLRAAAGVAAVATVDPVNADADYTSVAAAPDEYDAAVVACPASLHVEALAELAAKRRVRTVLVEKPLATSSADVERCRALAAAAGWRVMVGHTFLHHKTVAAMAAATFESWFGRLTTLYAKRTNLGPVRSDVGAHWDLAPHDLSIMLTLAARHQYTFHAVTAAAAQRGTVFMTLHFRHAARPAVVGHIHVSWEEPAKERRVVAVGTGGKVEFDDVWNPDFYRAHRVDGTSATVRGRAAGDASPLQRQIAEWAAGDYDTARELALAAQITAILEAVDGQLGGLQ